MRCSKCGTDNAAGAWFCNRCGTPLSKRCPKCAFDNAAEAKFCSQRAAPLDSGSPARGEAKPRGGPTGERRHLTVLFCDLIRYDVNFADLIQFDGETSEAEARAEAIVQHLEWRKGA